MLSRIADMRQVADAGKRFVAAELSLAQALDPLRKFFDLRHGCCRQWWMDEGREAIVGTRSTGDSLECALLVPVPMFSRHS